MGSNPELNKRTFQRNGKTYEIRIASDGATVRVRAFLDGRPAIRFEIRQR